METVSGFGTGLKCLSWIIGLSSLVMLGNEDFDLVVPAICAGILLYGVAEIICILYDIRELLKENFSSKSSVESVDNGEIEE